MKLLGRALLWSVAALLPQFAFAQFYGGRYHDYPIEAYFSGGGGMSSLWYKPSLGNYRYGFGGHVGLGAAFHFLINDHHLELSGGGEISFYNAKSTVDNLTYTSQLIRGFNGPPFVVSALLWGYEETQKALVFTFPVIMRYCFDIDTYHLYGGLGIKVGLPVSSSYSVRGGTIAATGLSEYENYPYQHIPSMGLDTYSAAPADKARIVRGTTAILALEFGMRWELPREWAIHTAVYADVGLNNIKYSSPNPFVSYYPAESGSAVRVSSIATSLYPTEGGNVEGAVSKRIAPLAAGIRLSVYFSGWDQLKNKNKKQPWGIDTTGFDTAKVAKMHSTVSLPSSTDTGAKSQALQAPLEAATAAPVSSSASLFETKPSAPVADRQTPTEQSPAPIPTPEVVSSVAQDNDYGRGDADRAADTAAVKKKKPRATPFGIQIVAASRKPRDTYFKQLVDNYPQFKMKTYASAKATHYVYGSFSTFEEAKRWVGLFVALGYVDAFVVQIEKDVIVKSFYNNKQ